MSEHDRFSEVLRASGLRQVDIAKLTGKDRRTVWRWCKGHTEVPEYAWTIVRQQHRIKLLAASVIDRDRKG